MSIDPDEVLPRDLPPRIRQPHVPARVRLRRTAGWYKPTGTIVVSRPTIWGNPYTGDPERAAAAYRAWLTGEAPLMREEGLDINLTQAARSGWADTLRARLPELRGHDLACWCREDAPCHADVLLDLANA